MRKPRNTPIKRYFNLADIYDNQNHVCWILGAGASYDCIGIQNYTAIPLTSDLIKTNMENGTNFPRIPVDNIIIDILEKFVSQKLLSSTDLVMALGNNLEKTFDDLRGLFKNSDFNISKNAVHCYDELRRHLSRQISLFQINAFYLEHLGHLEYCANNYLWLSNRSAHFPNWSILTLNYDEVLDLGFNMIYNLNLKPEPKQYKAWANFVKATIKGKKLKQSNHGEYLKLHGTLNVYECSNIDCSKFQIPFLDEDPIFLNKKVRSFTLERTDQNPNCPKCGVQAYGMLIPPGKNKSIFESIFTTTISERAIHLLKKSSIWFIVGYSFPEYDSDIITMLKSAYYNENEIKKDIVIINPNANEICERLKKKLDFQIFPLNLTFSEFIAKFWKYEGIKPPKTGITIFEG